MVLPPVTADPTAPPAAAPPTVPMVSPLPGLLPHAVSPASAKARTTSCLIISVSSDVRKKPRRGSVAAAQQEDGEQHRNRHAQGPQQDVPELAFLLPAPLLRSEEHTSELQSRFGIS